MTDNNNQNGNDAGIRAGLSDLERLLLNVTDALLGQARQNPPATSNIADAMNRAVASRHSQESTTSQTSDRNLKALYGI